MFLFEFRGEDVVLTRALFHSAHYVLAVSSSKIYNQPGPEPTLAWLFRASSRDPSLPCIGRSYKFCMYNSYFLVQDSLWIHQPYQILLPLPVSPYGPFYRLFYEGRSVKFSFLKKYYTDALTGVETGAISSTLSPWITQQPVSRTMLHSLF